jgi:hypothetical protein
VEVKCHTYIHIDDDDDDNEKEGKQILILSISPIFIHITGYNGLPSLISSGLDDSLSDIAAKKKYPFELEKAIHNVMFIQHHMQRQDEFNAVSYASTLPLVIYDICSKYRQRGIFSAFSFQDRYSIMHSISTIYKSECEGVCVRRKSNQMSC